MKLEVAKCARWQYTCFLPLWSGRRFVLHVKLVLICCDFNAPGPQITDTITDMKLVHTDINWGTQQRLLAGLSPAGIRVRSWLRGFVLVNTVI